MTKRNHYGGFCCTYFRFALTEVKISLLPRPTWRLYPPIKEEKMASTRKQLFSRATLERMASEPNGCVSLVESERKIELHPSYLNDIKAGVWDLLNKSLKKFDRSLNGILIGYKNIKVVVDGDTGKIKGRHGEFEVFVKLQFYIFQPRIGSYLEGVVNKKSKTHIGCLVHRYFNAVIMKPDMIEYEDWICRELDIDDKIVFKVLELDFSATLPHIVGQVDSDFIKENFSKKKKKKHTKEKKSYEGQSDDVLDESFLQIEDATKETQVEKKEDVKELKKEKKKHRKRHLDLPCNSTQRLSATGTELQDADFSFLSPVVPPVPLKKKKKEKRNSDEIDSVITSTQIPVASKDEDTSDFNMLSPIESDDAPLKAKKEKKKKKEKEHSGEKESPQLDEEGKSSDFYLFTPEEKKEKDEKNKKKKSRKVGEISASNPASSESKKQEMQDSNSASTNENFNVLLKSKKEKKKKKDKDKDRSRDNDKSDKNKLIFKPEDKPTENKKVGTNLKEKLEQEKAEKSFDPLEALELVMNKFKKPSSLDESDKSESDEGDNFIPATQIPRNEKSSNLPEVLSRTSFSKTDSDENSQKLLKNTHALKNKLELVNSKSPLKLKSPKKRGPSDSDSGSSSFLKKPKLESKESKDSFKNKLENLKNKLSPKKTEPAKAESPKKLFSPEKSLFSDSDASEKKSPQKKKIPEVKNLLIDDLLKEQKLTMLGKGDEKEVKNFKVADSIKKVSEAATSDKKSKRSKSEKKVTVPKTNKLLDEILQETKRSLLTEEKVKKEKSKGTKKDIINGTIDKRLVESSELEKDQKKLSSKKENKNKKLNKASSSSSKVNSTTNSTDMEIQELLAMALKNIGFKNEATKKKKKNISI